MLLMPTVRGSALARNDVYSLLALATLSMVLVSWPLDLTPEFSALPKLFLPAIAAVGFAATRSIGWRLGLSSQRDVLVALTAALTVGAAIIIFDSSSIQSSQYSLLWYAPKAATEEVLYRLGAMSVFASLLVLFKPDRTAGPIIAIAAAVLAQCLNLYLSNTVASGVSIYLVARFLIPGIVWGWLSYRHGFAAALIGQVGTHLWLDPAVAFAS